MANPYYDDYEYLDVYDEWGRRSGDPEYGSPPAGAPPPQAPAPAPPENAGGPPLPSGPGSRPNYLSDSLFEPWSKTFAPSREGLGTPQLPSIPGFAPPKLPEVAPFEAPAPFTYDKLRPTFSAPDPSKVFDDPTYRFREAEGRKGLENSAAASGLLRSGGTLKDFMKYGQQFAAGEYQNIYSRERDQHLLAADEFDTGYRNAADEYDRRFGNLMSTWGANRDTAFGQFDKELAGMMPGFQGKMLGYTTEAGAAQRFAEMEWQREFDAYMDEQAAFRKNQQDRFEREKWEWDFGIDAAGR